MLSNNCWARKKEQYEGRGEPYRANGTQHSSENPPEGIQQPNCSTAIRKDRPRSRGRSAYLTPSIRPSSGGKRGSLGKKRIKRQVLDLGGPEQKKKLRSVSSYEPRAIPFSKTLYKGNQTVRRPDASIIAPLLVYRSQRERKRG